MVVRQKFESHNVEIESADSNVQYTLYTMAGCAKLIVHGDYEQFDIIVSRHSVIRHNTNTFSLTINRLKSKPLRNPLTAVTVL